MNLAINKQLIKQIVELQLPRLNLVNNNFVVKKHFVTKRKENKTNVDFIQFP